MMKRLFVTMLMVMAASATMLAQSSSTILEKINSIKEQSNVYYWEENTQPTLDSAKVTATRWILNEINVNREVPMELETLLPHVEYLKINRGVYVRAFVYVKKDVVARLLAGESVSTSAVAQVRDFSATPPPSTSTPTATSTVTATTATLSTPIATPQQTNTTFVPEQYVQRIMERASFHKVYKYLEAMKAEGQMTQFGPLSDVEDYSSLDLILFDFESQQVVSVLSAVTSTGMRVNLTDGSPDSLDNYPQELLFVIWYIK